MKLTLPIVATVALAAFVVFRSREASAAPGDRFSATSPVGYRRLQEGDKITHDMVLAQQRQISQQVGTHQLHDDGFMTAVENPTGGRREVVIFVPIGSEYVR